MGVNQLLLERKNSFHWTLFPLFLMLLLLSCAKAGPENTGNPSAPEAAARAPDRSEPAKTTRGIVLVRGNYWAHGVPGFGTNGFLALTGEYRLLDFTSPGAGQETGTEENAAEKEFSVYLTREALYFSDEWQNRAVTGQGQVLQYDSEEGFHVAAILEDGRGTSWIAVFRFKNGLEAAGFSGDSFDRMLRLWAGRFLNFLSTSKSSNDLSLPAVVEF